MACNRRKRRHRRGSTEESEGPPGKKGGAQKKRVPVKRAQYLMLSPKDAGEGPIDGREGGKQRGFTSKNRAAKIS